MSNKNFPRAKLLEKVIGTTFRAMGTDVSVEITDLRGQGFLEEVKNVFTKNEKIFSRFNEGSELSKINSNLGKEIEISNEMLEVLDLCLKFNKISAGYFDPRIIGNLEKIGYCGDFKKLHFDDKAGEVEWEKIEGELKNDLIVNKEKKTVLARKRIDTTGIAKGYTVDEAAEYLRKQGFENFTVDAGGDMYAAGINDNGGWKIGIEGLDDDKLMLKLKDEGIATSGISRKRWTLGGKKFHHLINPKDPENFSFDIKTVTVIENKTVEADGRAKVLVLMGKTKGLEFANRNNIKALWLDYRGNVYLSEAIKGYLVK